MQMTRHLMSVELLAEPAQGVVIVIGGDATLTAAPADGKGPRRFSMSAYDGGPMRPKVDPPLPHPVVVDLSRWTCRSSAIPR
jgi:hypothetical protein